MTDKGGENLYSLFLNIQNKNDINLVKEIHDSEIERPFTISPLLKGAKAHGGSIHLSPNQTTSFRITYLKEELIEPIITGFMSISSKEKPLKFSNGEILIKKVDWQQGSKANFTSFNEILSRAQDESSVILEFCSATSFGSGEKQKLFPLPGLVFSSLLKKWNTYSNIKIPFNIKEDFEKIRVTQFRLKTEGVNFSNSKIQGCLGKVIYELPEMMRKEIKKDINALADFAFYSGAGFNTTMGMGQVRRIKKSTSLKVSKKLKAAAFRNSFLLK